jgi:DNA-binding transcriptional regulator YdaS (Cro superfamily)
MMNAIELYFQETGDNPSKLAERVGRSPSTITRPLNGERNASMDVALDVERGTDGKISAEQFLSICLTARRSRHEAAA